MLQRNKKAHVREDMGSVLVGVAGFEPTTTSPPD